MNRPRKNKYRINKVLILILLLLLIIPLFVYKLYSSKFNNNKALTSVTKDDRFSQISATHEVDYISKNKFQFRVPLGWRAYKDNFKYQSVYDTYVIYSPDYKELNADEFEGAIIRIEVSVPPTGIDGFAFSTTEQYVNDYKNDSFKTQISKNRRMIKVDDQVDAFQVDTVYEGFGTDTTFIFRDKEYTVSISYPSDEGLNRIDDKYQVHRNAYDDLINSIRLFAEY